MEYHKEARRSVDLDELRQLIDIANDDCVEKLLQQVSGGAQSSFSYLALLVSAVVAMQFRF